MMKSKKLVAKISKDGQTITLNWGVVIPLMGVRDGAVVSPERVVQKLVRRYGTPPDRVDGRKKNGILTLSEADNARQRELRIPIIQGVYAEDPSQEGDGYSGWGVFGNPSEEGERVEKMLDFLHNISWEK